MSNLTVTVIFNIITHKESILRLKNVFDSNLFYDLLDIEMTADKLYKEGVLSGEEWDTFYALGDDSSLEKEDVLGILKRIEREIRIRK